MKNLVSSAIFFGLLDAFCTGHGFSNIGLGDIISGKLLENLLTMIVGRYTTLNTL